MEEGASLKNLWELIKKICLFKIPPSWFYWLLIPIIFGMIALLDTAIKDIDYGNKASESAAVWTLIKIKSIILVWFLYMVICSIVNRVRHTISTSKCITHILISFFIAYYIFYYPMYL